MSPLDFSDYRAYLRSELELRMQTNPRYSLRSFARDLGVAPQNLSLVLKGGKGVSNETAAGMAQALGLDPEATHAFCDLVTLARARNEAARAVVRSRIVQRQSGREYAVLEQDVFRAISDWYHFAILELTYVRGFRSDIGWIARRLGVATHQASEAVDRLRRLGLLADQDGRLVKTDKSIATTHDVPSAALRKFHQQILHKATEALQQQHVGERDFTTMTMAIDPRHLPRAKEMIRDFRRKLTSTLEAGEQQDVYCLSIELFRLTQATEL